MTTSTSSISSLGVFPTQAALLLFEHLARTTWEWLGQARDLGISFSEETVTDITALQIAGARLNEIKVSKTTKPQEKRYGIDWMWFIGNRGQGYLRYAVQAKKITLDHSTNYSYRIRHPICGIRGAEFQIDVLEQFARKARAIPLYCFYNNVHDALAARHWHCLSSLQQPDDIRQMGCTLVPLDVIQVVHEPYHRKNFTAVHRDQRSIPWRCLFHPNCLVAKIHRRPADRAGIVVGQSPGDGNISAPSLTSLPEFLTRDGSIVQFNDVIQQLELTGLIDDGDSEADLSPGGWLAIPEWFAVIESEFTQMTGV